MTKAKIHRTTATTLLALAALIIVSGCAESKNAAGGSFTDPRDGKTYRTVKIGPQTWMAENLNFETEKSSCYDNADSSCTKYGRLYDWDDAMTACPAGWRLPSDEDWDSLALTAGGQRVEDGYGNYYWEVAGKKLKSTTGWKDGVDDDGKKWVSGNGTDEFGFSALPGHYYDFVGRFLGAGYNGNWWSGTEEDEANYAWHWYMSSNDDLAARYSNDKSNRFSVRCLQDFAAPQ